MPHVQVPDEQVKLAPHPGGHVPPHELSPQVLPLQAAEQQAPEKHTCPELQQAAPQVTVPHTQLPDWHV